MTGPSIRIVSLWEMLQISAPQFATPIYNFGMMAERLVHQATIARDSDHHSLLMSKSQFDGLIMSIHLMNAVAERLELPATLGALQRVAKLIEEFNCYGSAEFSIRIDAATRLGWQLTGVSTAFSDELHGRKFFLVQPHLEGLLDDSRSPFGACVDDAFPNAMEDISEAAKCLALGRLTASVFHLMRAMELAVRRMAEQLSIENVDKEWGKILSEMSAKIEAIPKSPIRDEWSEVHSHLYHVKQAWRNRTMHPKKTYTADEAKAVFEAVKSFMIHLAPLLEPT